MRICPLKGGGESNCGLPKFFISINLILCFIVSAVSILPQVQEALPNSGLLQSAVVTLYTTYLTWSAVANNPDRDCNPGFMGFIDGHKNKAQPLSNINAKQLMSQFMFPIRLHSTLQALLDWLFGFCAFCTVHCDQLPGWLEFQMLKNKVWTIVFLLLMWWWSNKNSNLVNLELNLGTYFSWHNCTFAWQKLQYRQEIVVYSYVWLNLTSVCFSERK